MFHKKALIISGSLAKNDLQFKACYGSSPPCINMCDVISCISPPATYPSTRNTSHILGIRLVSHLCIRLCHTYWAFVLCHTCVWDYVTLIGHSSYKTTSHMLGIRLVSRLGSHPCMRIYHTYLALFLWDYVTHIGHSPCVMSRLVSHLCMSLRHTYWALFFSLLSTYVWVYIYIYATVCVCVREWTHVCVCVCVSLLRHT